MGFIRGGGEISSPVREKGEKGFYNKLRELTLKKSSGLSSGSGYNSCVGSVFRFNFL